MGLSPAEAKHGLGILESNSLLPRVGRAQIIWRKFETNILINIYSK
jgi:hypothetical protein